MPPPDSPTPEEEARLRRLLAEARSDEPMPEDVAHRLEQALADLGEERAAGGSGDVVPLDHRRRRRRTVAGILAAAAVVVVAGVGVNEVLGSGIGDALQSSESAQAGAEADRSAASEEAASGEAGADDGLTRLDEAPADGAELLRTEVPVEVRRGPWQPPRIDERRLARDAQRVRRALPEGVVQREDRAVLFAPDDFSCAPEGWGAGIFVGVRYAGDNAVLALRQPSEQNQVAEVLQCGTGDTLRSVTLPAP